MTVPIERFLVAPRVAPPLDPGFRPAVLARRALAEATRRSPERMPVAVAVEQPGAAVEVAEIDIFGPDHPDAAASYAVCERLAKTLLWAGGGVRLWVDGPDALVAHLRRHYAEDPGGRFDAETMEKVYGLPLEVIGAARSRFPVSRGRAVSLGGHLDGCRIGFDLGASDRKAAAVIDGEVVFSEEIAWDASRQDDPRYHYEQIDDSLRRAAVHLPRVDAIGGSAAGIYVDNEPRSASLFRSIPPERFGRVRSLFRDLQAAWGGVPFSVANDGDVTALAGSMASGSGALLGIAMGSSEAGGYVTRERRLTSRINELAFVPIDYALDAPIDEWSGDRGCGALYFSQQCLPRLLARAGLAIDESVALPERLLELQRRMADGDGRAAAVYETIGTHLGYALLLYAEFYDVEHLLLLGRVMSGPGGDVIQRCARDVLATESARPIEFHEASERDKRHGQAVAAASLPEISRG